jgi:N-ethylmaleimide reductase
MKLLEPYRLGSLTLSNRLVMAPLTRRRASAGKMANTLMALYYAQRAGAGLIISESTEVDPRSGRDAPTRPGLFNEAQASAWSEVVDAVHARGGRIFVQLSHLGRASHPLLLSGQAEPVAPSAIAAQGNAYTQDGLRPFPVPRALDLEEIPEIIDQFAHAALLARDAGFDGVEVHGANGYLIDQFLRSGSNLRTDAYGGAVSNRVRFLAEVVEVIASIWSAEHVGVRLSPWSDFNGMSDNDPVETFCYAAEELDQLGIAYIHLIEPPGTAKPLAPQLRGIFGGSLILADGYDRDSGTVALENGTADLIGYGQGFIANPDLPERFERGTALNEPDRATFYSGGERGYTDYPALEAQFALS